MPAIDIENSVDSKIFLHPITSCQETLEIMKVRLVRQWTVHTGGRLTLSCGGSVSSIRSETNIDTWLQQLRSSLSHDGKCQFEQKL